MMQRLVCAVLLAVGWTSAVAVAVAADMTPIAEAPAANPRDLGFGSAAMSGRPCFNDQPVDSPSCAAQRPLPNLDVVGAHGSFGKSNYAVNDNFVFGDSETYSPCALNSRSDGTCLAAIAEYTVPNAPIPAGVGLFISGDVANLSVDTTAAANLA
jgi:hypothetical protein